MNELLIAGIRWYQQITRALIAARFPLFLYSGCRSFPTCSEYTIMMVRQHGAARGVAMGLWRVVKCNPLVAVRNG